jgi:hypothetical protein
MPAVVDPERGANDEIGRQSDERRQDEGPDDEGGESRSQSGSRKRVPEIAVEQPIPRQVGNSPAGVLEKLAAEGVSGGVHGRERPRVPDELTEQRVDSVQSEEECEPDRDQEMNSEERRKPDSDAECDRGGDPFGRFLPAEQIREQDFQPPRELQGMEASPPECAGGLPFHGATPKWS